QIVVLVGALEHLLERACLAAREDDAVGGEREQHVLADAVLEIFRDPRRQRSERLVAIVPGWHAEAGSARLDHLSEQLVGRYYPGVQLRDQPAVRDSAVIDHGK